MNPELMFSSPGVALRSPRDERPARNPAHSAAPNVRNSSGSQICDQLAIAQQHNPVPKIECLVEIVRHQQDRLPQTQPADRAACPASRRESEDQARRKARPSEEFSGRRPKRARQSNALALASRELVRIPMREARWIQTHGQQQLMASAYPLNPRAALRPPAPHHIALDREMRKQARFLNHIADAAAQSDQIRVREPTLRSPALRRPSATPCGSRSAAEWSFPIRCAPAIRSWCPLRPTAKCLSSNRFPCGVATVTAPKLDRCAHVNAHSVYGRDIRRPRRSTFGHMEHPRCRPDSSKLMISYTRWAPCGTLFCSAENAEPYNRCDDYTIRHMKRALPRNDGKTRNATRTAVHLPAAVARRLHV